MDYLRAEPFLEIDVEFERPHELPRDIDLAG
jgi:hypothetical protein